MASNSVENTENAGNKINKVVDWKTISRSYSFHCDYQNIFESLPNVARLNWADLKEITPIANGHGSSVFSGLLDDDNYEGGERPIIIKTARREDLGPKGLVNITREMMRETVFLDCIGNQHGLVKLVGHGYVSLGDGMLNENSPEAYFLVLERLEGGTLESFISSLATRPTRSFSFMSSSSAQSSIGLMHLVVLRELAAALKVLHHIAPTHSIIHRDLKPANMGFHKDGTFSLFDLGLAAALANNSTEGLTGVVGSVRYMAPEVALKMRYGRPVDVYSFAIVAFELTHGEKPFKGMGVEAHRELVSIGKLRPDLDPKKLPKTKKGKPTTTDDTLAKLIVECWDHEPRVRPPMTVVVDRLDALIRDVLPACAGDSPEARAQRASITAQFFPGAQEATGGKGNGKKTGKWSIF